MQRKECTQNLHLESLFNGLQSHAKTKDKSTTLIQLYQDFNFGLAKFANQKDNRLQYICNGIKLFTHTKQHPLYSKYKFCLNIALTLFILRCFEELVNRKYTHSSILYLLYLQHSSA